MQIVDLETFIVLTKAKSFSKAAQILYISQPALTQRIQKLENELGFSLIDRKQKTIFALTEAGEHFLTFAQNTMQSYTTTMKECQSIAETTRKSFTIGMEQFDLPFLNREKLYQGQSLLDYDVHVEYCMHADLMDHLLHHDYDCIFLAKPATLPKGYSFLPIATDYFSAIFLEEAHITSSPVTLQELSQHPLFFPKIDYEDFLHLQKQITRINPHADIHYYSTISLLNTSLKNSVFISNMQKKSIFQIAKCIPLDTKDSIQLGFIYPEDINSELVSFLKTLQSHI